MKALKIILKILLALAWTCASVFLSQYIFYHLFAFFDRDFVASPFLTLLYAIFQYALTLALAILLPYKLLKQSRPARDFFGLSGLPTFIDIGLSLVGFCVFYVLAAVLISIFTQFPWFDPTETQEVGFDPYLFGLDRLFALVSLVLVAPIAEELLFRGYLYAKLRSIIKNPVVSVVLSTLLVSALFAFLHGQWNVAVTVFCLSVVLCLLREVTGTIYAGIILHILKNGIAFLMIYYLNMV